MTARERVVIRAVIRALKSKEHVTMDALCVSYGVSTHYNKPIKDVAVGLLQALVDASNDRA